MLKKLFIIPFLFTSLLFAQISSFSPKKPVAGDTVKIIYNPYADSAKYSINDDVYAILSILKGNGDLTKVYKEMRKNDSVFVCSQIVVNNTAAIQIYFVAIFNKAFDFESNLMIPVYNNSKPVMNPFNDDFETELKNYPNNYADYARKWFLIKYSKPDTYKDTVNYDLRYLINVKDTSLGLLYTLSYGYLLTNNLGKSYLIIEKMINEFPKNSFTANAAESFAYELSMNNKNLEYLQKIKDLLNNYAVRERNSADIRELIEFNSTLFFADSTISIVCSDWIAAQKDNPVPFGLLGFIKFRQNNNSDNLKSAEELIKQSIKLTLQGKYRLYHDISGSKESTYLSSQYYELAKVQFQMNNLSEALSNIKAAIDICSSSFYIMYDLEGDIWKLLNNYNSAEKAYLEAWKLGSKDAKDKILDCYKMNHNDTTGFDNYFASISRKQIEQTNTNRENIKKASPFSVVSLNGKKLSLKNLTGRVIVLNFWFTGCGPCKAEIPKLNQLVNKYKNKKVTFIAFALDDDKALLKKYLKLNPFDYEIIPGSEAIAKDYKITAYPTHIVINQKREIIARIVGGINYIGENISRVIDRIL